MYSDPIYSVIWLRRFVASIPRSILYACVLPILFTISAAGLFVPEFIAKPNQGPTGHEFFVSSALLLFGTPLCAVLSNVLIRLDAYSPNALSTHFRHCALLYAVAIGVWFWLKFDPRPTWQIEPANVFAIIICGSSVYAALVNAVTVAVSFRSHASAG